VAHARKIAVIGLGYVGLPVAVAFARGGASVIGFDINPQRVAEIAAGQDRTREVAAEDLQRAAARWTSDPRELAGADFFIVTVPTPIDDKLKPDLGALLKATELAGGRDFTVGYSPERINPGDKTHRFETITKVVAGQDARTLQIIAAVYGSVVGAEIYRAPSIKVAEAAKVIENTQRDLNIAFMNELSELFHVLGIDTADVLAAAGTKWNFLPFTPGLVGGHCIGVDPYYLTHRAKQAGFEPKIILAGRRVNDAVGTKIARQCLRLIEAGGRRAERVSVLGLTFKENVPDIRNSKVVDIVRELSAAGIAVQVHDPIADATDACREYGIELAGLDALQPADAVVLAVAHEQYDAGWPLIMPLLRDGKGVVIDVKARLDRNRIPAGVELWRL